MKTDHVERKVQLTQNKGKLLPKIEDISREKAHANLFKILRWTQTFSQSDAISCVRK